MGMKRDNLEWQLNRASTALSAFEKELDGKQIAADARLRNAKWRNLNAVCRQLRRRLTAVAKLEANNAEVAQRKAAGSAEATAAG
jgi:Tfp pilus assembly protein PilN